MAVFSLCRKTLG